MSMRTRIVSCSVISIFLLYAMLSIGMVSAVPDPYSCPDQIGDFGQLQSGDEIVHAISFNDASKSWYHDQNTQDVLYLLLLVAMNGNTTMARNVLTSATCFLDSIEDIKIHSVINDVTQPNATFVGEVSGTISTLNFNYEALYSLLTALYFINETELTFEEFQADFASNMTDVPANFSVLTVLQDITSGSMNYVPMPIFINNNWSYWGAALAEFNDLISPLINIGSEFTKHGRTSLNSFHVRIDINVSELLINFNDTLFYMFDNETRYEAWLSSWENLTIDTYSHVESGALLEAVLSINMTNILDNLQEVFSVLHDATHEDLYLFIVNIINELPRPGIITSSIYACEFKYGGEYVIGGEETIPFPSLLYYATIGIGVTLLIVIAAAVGGGVSATMYLLKKKKILLARL